MPINFPSNPLLNQTFTRRNVTYTWDGSSWMKNVKLDVTTNVSAVNFDDSAEHSGILINSANPWVDIIGTMTPRQQGSSTVTFEPFVDSIGGWAHPVSSSGDVLFHIPHEYAVNTDLFMHLHWGHPGNNINGTFNITYDYSFAPRTYPVSAFSSPKSQVQQLTSLNITNTPKWGHRVDEIQISTPGGSTSKLDTAAISVDGLLLVHYTVNAIPSISGASQAKNLPYIFTIDLHMQSRGLGTKNKDPNFYN